MNKMRYETKKKWAGFFFTVPWIIGFIYFFLIPVINSVRFSVSSIDVKDGVIFKYIGFEHYTYLFQSDPNFVVNLLQSIADTFTNLALIIAFSLFVAILLVQNFRGRLAARAIFFLPVIIASGAILGIIKGDSFSQQLFQSNTQSSQFQLTVLQNILMNAKFSVQSTSTIIGMLNSIFDISWKCGMQILIFMAGLQAIPPSVKEAALVEGATGWEFFWKITFPMIMPMIQLNIIYTIVDSFTDYSNPIVKRIFELNQKLDYSFSSAVAWTYFSAVFLIIIAVYFLLSYRSRRENL